MVAITLTSMSASGETRVLRRWAALRLSTRKSAQPHPHNAGTPAVSNRTAVFALGLGNAVQWYDFALCDGRRRRSNQRSSSWMG
jgi:hypothetical protein